MIRIKKFKKEDLIGIDKEDLRDIPDLDELDKEDEREVRRKLLGRKAIMIICAIIAAIFLFYGLAVASVNSGSKFFMVWLLGAAVFAAPVVMIIRGYTLEVSPLGKKIIFFVVGFLLALLIVTQFMVLSKFNSKGEKGLDYIIVLGAQVKDDGPSAVLKYRLDAAAEYCKENPHTIVIVSGGKGSNESASEASVMRDYLVTKGVDIDKILVEDQSKNTDQNIKFSAEFLDPSTNSVGIVTNNFHVFRAVQLAKGAGYKNICGISAKSTPFFLPNNMARESVGIVKDFVFGHFF